MAWRLVICGAALFLLLGAFAPRLSFDRGEQVLAAASRMVGSDPVRLVRVRGDAVASIQVESTAGLVSALKGAQAGDTILLAPGVYSGLTSKGMNASFDVPVTITSAVPSQPAVITDFSLADVHGLTFRNLEFLAVGSGDQRWVEAKYWAFKVAKSSDIHFDNVSVHGSLDGDVTNDVLGINIRDSDNVSVTNSEFQQLGRALAIGGGDNVKVINNHVHDMRSDGFDFAQVGHVQVVDNILRDFYPVGGDHPDAIQFWTSGTKSASHDILISGNVILRGDGQGTQGIFLRDQLGTLPYERVTISDNLVVGTGYNAIRVQGAKDLTLTANELVTFKDDYKSFLLIQGADGVVAQNNRAVSISFGDSVNVSESGNVTTGFVKDLGLAAIKKWLEAHPTRAAHLDGILPIDLAIEPVDPTMETTLLLDVGHSLFGGLGDFLQP